MCCHLVMLHIHAGRHAQFYRQLSNARSHLMGTKSLFSSQISHLALRDEMAGWKQSESLRNEETQPR
jgi:hypothetical protein